MTTIGTNPKLAYIYDLDTDTWYPLASKINPAANYSWTGANSFSGSVSFDQNVVARTGVNNFLNYAARDAAIPSPTNGLVVFIRQDNYGEILNTTQYYHNGLWKPVEDALRLLLIVGDRTLSASDAGRSFKVYNSGVDGASSSTITIPLDSVSPFTDGHRTDIIRMNAGPVVISPAVGVTLYSKSNYRYISSPYSAVTLTKINPNTWLLVGDLSAS